MDWKEKFDERYGEALDEVFKRGVLVALKDTPSQNLKSFISTEIIEALIEEAREAIRKCDSPRNIVKPPLAALQEARLIQRIDAMDAIEQLRSQWLGQQIPARAAAHME